MSKPLAARVLTIALSLALSLAPFAAPAFADAPATFPFVEVFTDENPCTGEDQTITVTGTAYVHEHERVFLVHVDRTITTSAGFEGTGSSTFVNNGEVLKLSLRDMLASDSGARMRAGFIFVFDLSLGTVKAFHGGVICVRP